MQGSRLYLNMKKFYLILIHFFVCLKLLDFLSKKKKELLDFLVVPVVTEVLGQILLAILCCASCSLR